MRNKNEFYGIKANEDWNLFIFNKKSDKPIVIENIGITHANPRYMIKRENSDLFVFEYVLSGEGYIEIDGKIIKVEANDVYCLEPGMSYCYYSDKNNPMEKIWINFYSDLFKEIFKYFNLSGKILFKNTNTLDLFNELQYLKRISNFSDDICYEIAPVLFNILCQLGKSNIVKRKSQNDILVKTKQLLDESLYSNITMDIIADKVGVSKSHIIREFSKYYGCTPYNYLIDQKIAIAKKLITLSNMKISDISNTLGFNDSHYFSRIFKIKTGLSPQQYKNKKTK